MGGIHHILLVLCVAAMDASESAPIQKHLTLEQASADDNTVDVSFDSVDAGPIRSVSKDPLAGSMRSSRGLFERVVTADGTIQSSKLLVDSTPKLSRSVTRKVGAAGAVEVSGRFGVSSQGKGVGKLQAVLSPLVQTLKGVTAMSVLSQTILRSLCSLLLVAIVLLSIASYGLARVRKQRALDRAQDDLRIAVQQAAHYTVLRKENVEWRHTLTKLRELREGTVSKNHPLYHAIEAHMDDPGILDQLQSLFSELSEGEPLLAAEKLRLLFSSFRAELRDGATGRLLEKVLPIGFEWIINDIGQPLTCSTFMSIFVLFLLTWCFSGMMNSRGDGSTQSKKDEDVSAFEIEYYVEIYGHEAYRAILKYGNFRRLGASVYVNREVNVETFESDG